MPATITLPTAEDQQEIIKDLEMIGCNVPADQTEDWTAEQWIEAETFASEVDKARNADEGETTAEPQVPEFLRLWLPTEGQTNPVEYAKDIEQPDDIPAQLDRVNRHMMEIRAQEARVAEAESEWKESKEITKECKATFDSEVSRLRSLIRKRPDQPELPFPEDNGQPQGGEPVPDDDWGLDPITDLQSHGLTESKCEALQESLVAHGKAQARVRDLRDWIQENPHWHRDVKGVGEKTLDPIIDALNSYYESHPVEDGEDDDKTIFDAEDDDD